jgi:hypothetical protein
MYIVEQMFERGCAVMISASRTNTIRQKLVSYKKALKSEIQPHLLLSS